jgi:phosphomannomutase/phosphoglucomutase
VYINSLKNKEITKCSELFSNLPNVFNTPEIRIECPENKKFKVADSLKEAFLQYKNKNEKEIKEIIDIDGIRVVFKNGWGLLRASNTQPELVMRFEAIDKESLEEYKELFEKELEKIL